MKRLSMQKKKKSISVYCLFFSILALHVGIKKQYSLIPFFYSINRTAPGTKSAVTIVLVNINLLQTNFSLDKFLKVIFYLITRNVKCTISKHQFISWKCENNNKTYTFASCLKIIDKFYW